MNIMYSGFTESEQAAFDAAIVGQVREFRHRVKFGYWSGTPRRFNAQLTMEDGIRSISINQMVNADSSMLTMGSACSSMLKLEFYKPETSLNLSNKVIKIECGLKCGNSYLYVPMGCYNIDEFTSEDDFRTIQIVAYDDMQKLSEAWETSLTYPQTAKQVIAEIASAHQISVEYSTFAGTALNRIITHADAEKLLNYSTREVLGILAGIAGGNAFFTQSGALRFGWYDESNVDVPLTLQWQGGLKKTQSEPFTIQSVTSGVDDAVYTAGTGKGISFVNPIITHDEIDAIQESVASTEFLSCEVNWRGNPCIGCGDAVTVYDKGENGYTVFITEQEIDLTGGLSQKIVCPSADGELSFSTADTETQRSISRVRTDLQNAIAAATARIIGANGGHITPIDTDGDGTLDTLIISETPVDLEHPEDTNGEVIRINRAGIGLSSTGYNGPFVTAVTGAGINANAITAGSISADMLSIGTAAKIRNIILDGDFSLESSANNNNPDSVRYWGWTQELFSSVKFDFNDCLCNVDSLLNSGERHIYYKKYIPVKPNTDYFFGATVTCPGDASHKPKVDLIVQFYNSSDQLISAAGLPNGSRQPEPGTTHRYNNKVTTPSGTAYVYFYISINHTSGYTDAVSFNNVALFEAEPGEVYEDDSMNFPFDNLLDPQNGNVSVTGKGIDIYQGAVSFYAKNGDCFYFGSDDVLWYSGFRPEFHINNTTNDGYAIVSGGGLYLYPETSIGANVTWLRASGEYRELEIVGNLSVNSYANGAQEPILVTDDRNKTDLYANLFRVINSNNERLLRINNRSETDLYANLFWVINSNNENLLRIDNRSETDLYTNLFWVINSNNENLLRINNRSETDLYANNFSIFNSSGSILFSVEGRTLTEIWSQQVNVSGNITANSFNQRSDALLKTHITPAGSMLDKIVAAGIYNYDYVSEVPEAPVIGTQSEDYTPPTPQHYGLVIGDGYNTPEEVVSKDGKGIDLYSMISIAWKAIQEQQAQIDELQQRISVLEGSNDAN